MRGMGADDAKTGSLAGELGSLATLLQRVADVETAAPADLLASLDDPDLVIERRLGAGGMGVVFLARDVRLDRRVAVKVHKLSGRPGATAALLAEAQAMARLAHPNVVALYDVRQAGDHLLLMMEYVRGKTLRDWLAAEPRSRAAILDAFAAAGAGLAAAHGAGLVHRDFKPDNVIVGDDGRVRVADFGLARAIEGSSAGEVAAAGPAGPLVGDALATVDPAETVPGGGDPWALADVPSPPTAIAGTPAYMAPEQIERGQIDARTDQYAFCLALVEALRGRHPLADSAPTALLDSGSRDRLLGSPEVAGVSPAWLRRIIVRGLSPDPAARFADMDALLRALARGRQRRAPRIAAAVGLVAALGGGAWLAMRAGGGPDCDGVAHELDAVWNETIRARAAAAVDALGLPYGRTSWDRIGHDLDGYAHKWTLARRAVCRAGPHADDAVAATLARQTRCLDERRDALAQLTRTLAAPDEKLLGHAGTLAASLPAVADCSDVGSLAAVSGNRGASGHADLATARAAFAAGRYQETLAAAQRAAAAADASHDRALAGEAARLAGRALARLDRLGEAVQALQQAADVAGELGATSLQIDAWISLGMAYQNMGNLEDAERSLKLAEAALAKAPHLRREAYLLESQGTLAGRRGDFETAKRLFEGAIAKYAAMHVEDTPLAAASEHDLAIVYRRLGRPHDALVHARRALELDRSLGAEHPTVAIDHLQLAPVWDQLGQREMARYEIETARAILSRQAPEGSQMATVENELGVLASRAQQADQAVAHFRASLAIYERTMPDSNRARTARANLADALRSTGKLDEAERMLRDTLADDIAKLGEQHPEIAHVRRGLSNVLVDRGRYDDALTELHAARAIYEARPNLHPAAADTLRREAEVLRLAGRWRQALAQDRASLALREQASPQDHQAQTTTLAWIAADELHLGHADQALADAERAAARFRDLHDETDAAIADFTAAQASWQRGRDRAAALGRARHARDVVAAIAPLEHDPDLRLHVLVMDIWLSCHVS